MNDVMNKKLPTECPSCGEGLKISELVCVSCDTKISGLFDLPLLARLSEQEQQFVLDFVKCSGSLKEMAKTMELSYPTVRNMLDDLILKISKYE